jgi:hypothetical protein
MDKGKVRGTRDRGLMDSRDRVRVLAVRVRRVRASRVRGLMVRGRVRGSVLLGKARVLRDVRKAVIMLLMQKRQNLYRSKKRLQPLRSIVKKHTNGMINPRFQKGRLYRSSLLVTTKDIAAKSVLNRSL